MTPACGWPAPGQQAPVAGWRSLPPVDLLILGTYSQEIPNLRNENRPPQLPRHQHRLRGNNPCSPYPRTWRSELELQNYNLKLL